MAIKRPTGVSDVGALALAPELVLSPLLLLISSLVPNAKGQSGGGRKAWGLSRRKEDKCHSSTALCGCQQY